MYLSELSGAKSRTTAHDPRRAAPKTGRGWLGYVLDLDVLMRIVREKKLYVQEKTLDENIALQLAACSLF